MDFALSEEQQAIFDMAYAFGQDRIAPHAAQWEAEGDIPKSLWPEVGALGFGGLYVSEENGGAGLGRLDATLVFEALSMACPAVAAFLSIHNMCARMLDSFASEELRARLMPGVISMETVLSYCLTEPGSGSDAAALKTRAEAVQGGYRLNGTKAFISGGGYSDGYVVMARTGGDGPRGVSTLYVPAGTEGLSFGGLEQKMGWKAQPTRQVQFDNCDIPAGNLVGDEGSGFKYAMMGLDGGRLNISACSVGGAQAALNKTLTYMGERKAFGQSIDQFQALQFKLADMEIQLQAARVMLRQAAWKLDQKSPDATKFCAMAKAFVTEAGSQVVNTCLQLHGGYGYLSDYGIEKLVRDLRVHEILEGTNEIMRVITARTLLAER
ncbi:acyl-CoA dehydrogenase family protein [Pseudooceanicola nanhaiensis]|uniref:acyl-CoA dehydrogenase family protein n=1 Tax=Pseudooceanicola nanhaiensis TaxID=375761 RepID=UPI001CD4D4C9|nr:acyl-CoA dehydrogenase family protein [Pseudooceanicola nanhaiensis]MCA0920042.1 acyl-CoA dehydrogenase family protein [Pseudooceanicola nanhaiensis]